MRGVRETALAVSDENDDRLDRLTNVLSNPLAYTVNEPVLLDKLEEFLSPKPAKLVNSDAEEQSLNKRVDELQRNLGGVPRLIISKDGEPPPTYDVYAEAALSEMLSAFHRCRRSVVRTHMHYIGLGLSDRYDQFLDIPDDEELKNGLSGLVEERFWEHAETSFIRLASYWDRVGQLFDFVYFNIRQYERDGFASVMQRIAVNFAVMDAILKTSSDWEQLSKYKRSENQDGFVWLARRRNLIVHSLYLRRIENDTDEESLFLSEYNHLEAAVRRKLLPGSPEEELRTLHEQLKQAASLVPAILGVAEHGARLNRREERL